MASNIAPKSSDDPAMGFSPMPIDNAPAASSKTKNKSKSTSAAPKKPPAKPRPAPLPATVEARGYEITIPNVKTCWRVHVLHGCGHPVLDEASHQPLVIDITRHLLRACTARCKVESMEHIVASLCGVCLRLREELREEEWWLEPASDTDVGVMSPIAVVHGMPLV